mgnify:CR=1 FL=1
MTITLSHQELKDLIVAHEKATQAWAKEVVGSTLEFVEASNGAVAQAKARLALFESKRPIFTLL